MNPSIALQGQVPDLAGAIMRGREGYQQQQEFQHQNALRDYMRTNGAGVMAGEQNALAGLAAYDPSAALGIQDQRLGMDQTRLQMDATKQGMGESAERLNMAREQARMQAAEHTAAMNAEQRAQAAAELDQGLAMATQARDQQEWDEIMSGFGEAGAPYVGQFDNKDRIFAGMLGLRDALEMNAEPEYRPATPEEAAQYGAVAGQVGPGGEFKPMNPPSGMSLSTGPDGTVTFNQGPGVKPLTEGQSKDNFYLSAMTHARDLDSYESALVGATGAGNQVAGAIPVLGSFLQSEEYQIGTVAAKEWAAAALRKESGAALTKEDMAWAEARYIPVPGDKPGTINRKRIARRAAEAGMKSGMSPAQIDAVVDGLAAEFGEQAAAPGAAAPEAAAAPATPMTSDGITDFDAMSDAELDAWIAQNGR